MSSSPDPERRLSEALRAQAGGQVEYPGAGQGSSAVSEPARGRRRPPVLAVLLLAILLGALGGAVLGYLSL